MCSVREACRLLKSVKTIQIGWNGCFNEFNQNDPMQMLAYGDFAVDEIEVHSPENVGIVIAFAPIKAS